MNELLLTFYHGLPTSARNVAASLRGLYLRRWRYGPESEKLMEAALDRERWSSSQWSDYINNRLAYVLYRAAKQVPYYRRYWAQRRLSGDKRSCEYLENWPVLEKKMLRENPTAFVADDCNLRAMFCDHTSGTTGTPLRIWSSRETIRDWYALVEARCRGWYGVSRKDRWAILGGQLVTPVVQTQPPFWVWNRALKQLYMSSYHLSSKLTPYYLDALETYSVRYLWGYSSSLYSLAQTAVQLKRQIIMRVVITNAEPLFQHQREVISAAFGCPVRETYGMCEMVAAASECESNQLHSWPEVGFVETAHSGSDLGTNAAELLCTSLLNADMPLIRYRVGDVGTVDELRGPCSCGRSLPLMSTIEGRTDDLLHTVDGRVLGRLDPVFKGNLPIRAAQIVQNEIDCLTVRYVPTAGFDHKAASSIVAEIKARMGEVRVILEKVEDIPRDSNGKFRAVICNISRQSG